MQERRLAAIMFTDIVGYTALMGSDEDQAFEVLRKNREIHLKFIKQFKGTLIKEMGDGMLISFDLASEAVRCAIEIQKAAKSHGIPLKIGIHEGEMVFEGNDVLGDGVNIASRIQEDTEAGFIMVSGSVYRDIKNKVDIKTEFIEEKKYKNVDEEIKIYCVICSEIHKDTMSAIKADYNESEKKSIIVLPFENMSPDPDQEYFSDGLTEEIITDLSHIQDFLVISRSTAMTFKGSKKKIKEIAREVSVRYALEGSVRKAGNDLRITAQLIDAKTDSHIWAEKYKGTLDDVFDIQEKVSQDICTILKLKLTTGERNRMALRPINNFEAFDFFLRAYREFWVFTEDALNRGLKYLQQAANIIGDNDLLYSAMALIHFQFVNIGSKQEIHIIEAEEFAYKALALNPDSAKAHHIKGIIALRIYGNPYDAVRYLKRALALEPSLLAALISLIATYCYCGKISAAVPLVEKFKRINPLSFQRYYIEGFLHFYDGKYEAALYPFFQSYKIDPVSPANMHYAWTLAYLNKYNEAISVIDQRTNVDFEDLMFKCSQMLKFALHKMNENVLKMVTPELKKTCKKSGALSHIIADILALTGEKEQTLELLENAVDSGFINYPLLAEKDPWLQKIRGKARFKKLMEKVKYKWENFEV